MKSKINSFWKLIIVIIICEGIGLLSGLLSQGGINNWFKELNKPSWNPPDNIFGPVWAILYFLMAISLWLIWKKDNYTSKEKTAFFVFGSQLFFNFWWSVLFFRFHSPALAFVDILILLLLILIAIYSFSRISKMAAILLLPYLFWVSFASYLNYIIWVLN